MKLSMEDLGRRLKEIREEKGLTIKEVIEQSKINCSEEYLSEIEKGEVKRISPVFLKELAIFYVEDPFDFLDLAGYVGKAERREYPISKFGEGISHRSRSPIISRIIEVGNSFNGEERKDFFGKIDLAARRAARRTEEEAGQRSEADSKIK